jgi:hypothetical protein
MSAIDNIPQKLGISDPWVQQGGVYWLVSNSLNIRAIAAVMGECHARLVTITAFQLPEQGFRLDYHWDLEGKLMGFSFQLAGNSIESIYDLCEAADWIEREIHDHYAVEFLGRECEPLLLRTGDTLGANLREETK